MEGPEIQFAEATIDNGQFGTRTIRFETGRLAKQAGGAVAAYLDGETMLLSTTTAGKTPKDHFDFFPLTVDVEERMYAAGRIPGSFFRREGRPSTDAILTCRLIDRPLRPTFRKGLRNEVQVVISVLSVHPDHQYDVLAINAASASTQISGLPFSGPIGAVRVSLIDGQWVAFPNFSDIERSTFDMVVAGRIVGDLDGLALGAQVKVAGFECPGNLAHCRRPLGAGLVALEVEAVLDRSGSAVIGLGVGAVGPGGVVAVAELLGAGGEDLVIVVRRQRRAPALPGSHRVRSRYRKFRRLAKPTARPVFRSVRWRAAGRARAHRTAAHGRPRLFPDRFSPPYPLLSVPIARQMNLA